jgi:diadenosine tetraphosphate (Ap4A) HIT family hydrolase
MRGCLACELTSGERRLPGGTIHETQRWVVEHCVGPLGVGTLIVKPKRHVTHVWGLDDAEASELGPLIKRAALAIDRILGPEQVYVTLWSHAEGKPGHIHWVLQPVPFDRDTKLVGPHLQAAMFDSGEIPETGAVESVAEELRGAMTQAQGAAPSAS